MQRHIEATVSVRTPLDTVMRVLTGPNAALGEHHPRTGSEPTSYLADVDVDLGAGSSVREQVKIHCARRFTPQTDTGEWELDWEPVGHRRLLPAFHGHLSAAPSETGAGLRLAGSYRPPLGVLGAAGDTIVGRRVATGALGSFLAGLAERIDREADRRGSRPDQTPAREATRRSDGLPSEAFVG